VPARESTVYTAAEVSSPPKSIAPTKTDND
jgi:hypothetical protein